MKNEIEPCPFCGNNDRYAIRMVNESVYTRRCRDCGAEGPQADSEKRANHLWNQRAISEKPAPEPSEFGPVNLNDVEPDIINIAKPPLLNEKELDEAAIEHATKNVFRSENDGEFKAEGRVVDPDMRDSFVAGARFGATRSIPSREEFFSWAYDQGSRQYSTNDLNQIYDFLAGIKK